MSQPSDVNPDSFWSLVRSLIGRVTFLLDAVAMWYAMVDPETPWWARCLIAGALVYFITPLDVIPDFLPGGWVDDAGAITAALATVRCYVTDRHYEQAREALGMRRGVS